MKKPKSQTYWRNKCDALARERCLERAGHRCEAEGAMGLKCGTKLDWAHLKSRRFALLRHDPKNSMILCSTHHRYFHDHPDRFYNFVDSVDGARWPYLNERLRQIGTVKTNYKLIYEGLTEMEW